MRTVSGAENYSVRYSYDLNNRLLKTVQTEGDKETITEFGYGNNGNQIMTSTSIIEPRAGASETSLKEVWLQEYDGFNRMSTALNDGNFMTDTYRPDGLRHSKEVNGEKSVEIWEGQMLGLELDESGQVIDQYIRGVNLIKSDLNGFYIYNAHGDCGTIRKQFGCSNKELPV